MRISCIIGITYIRGTIYYIYTYIQIVYNNTGQGWTGVVTENKDGPPKMEIFMGNDDSPVDYGVGHVQTNAYV